MKYTIALFVIVASFACDINPLKKTKFTTNEKINNQDPSAAVYTFFGWVTFVLDDNDGWGDNNTGFVVVASSDPNLCNNTNGDFKKYIDRFRKGKVDGTLIVNSIFIHGDLETGMKYDGDEKNVINDLIFGISNGMDPIVLATDHSKGTLKIEELPVLGTGNASGSISTRLVREQVKSQKINTLLNGYFTGERSKWCNPLNEWLVKSYPFNFNIEKI